MLEFPKCQKCNNGTLIPLSDYGQEGASVIFKAWACTNPDCGFSLRVDKGEITYGKRIEPKQYSYTPLIHRRSCALSPTDRSPSRGADRSRLSRDRFIR